jgi:hypothetical protein
VYALATATVSVLRGTTTDEFGDEVDGSTVHESGIPAYLTEKTETVFDPGTQTPRVVRMAMALLPHGTDVTDEDRLRDDSSGITYIVDDVIQTNAPGQMTDLKLVLRRVT